MASYTPFATTLHVNLTISEYTSPAMPSFALLVRKSPKFIHSPRLSTDIPNLGSCFCTDAFRSNFLDNNGLNRLQSPSPPLRSSTHAHRRRLSVESQAVASAPLPATESRPSSSIREIQRQLASGERSAEEVTSEYLDRLEATEPLLQSFLHVDREGALAQARSVDVRRSKGHDLGPLAGIPVGVKDNLCTADMPSTGGSRVLEGYRPPYDATAVALLRAAGAVLIGKTNLDEFGMGSSTENSGYQVTSNPWDLSRLPGGSSGGSAAAVAGRQCVAALGSDTGGSIRQPASFCGCVGVKPTYGRVSRFGLMAYASSLDVIGCLASSVEDAGLVLAGMAGRDGRDATSSGKAVGDYLSAFPPPAHLSSRPLAGRRFGLVRETVGEGVDPAVVAAVREAGAHLEGLGAVVEEVSLPSFSFGLPAYYVLAPSEASSNLARYDGVRYGPRGEAAELVSLYSNSRGAGFGAEVKRRILMGTYALSAGYYDAVYKRAQQVRTLIQRDFSTALESFDALITPTAPTPAFKKGENRHDPLAAYAGDMMTVNVNLAGLPAIAVPCGLAPGGHAGLPIGLQMIGRPFGEESLLHYAYIYEQTTLTWHHRPPPLA